MRKYILSRFAKEEDDLKNPMVRAKIGTATGYIGIVSNLLLVIIKIVASIITSSTAVFVDAINNLFDIVSSVVTIISFKLASKPADREHPFGHGRIEYFASLIVGVIIALVGWDFAKSSFLKILSPQPVTFSLVPFLLLIFSAVLKIWLSRLNKDLGEDIDSGTLKATGDDAFNDVLTSGAVAISVLVSPLTTFPVDAIIGFIVSIIIIKSAFDILKENSDPLMGKAPSEDMLNLIWEEARKTPKTLSVHDLLVSSYGPSNYVATLHMEFPTTLTALEMHNITEVFERKMLQEHSIEITVHVDPIDIYDKEWQRVKKIIDDKVLVMDEIVSTHGHRILNPKEEGQYVIFDAVYDCDNINTFEKQENLRIKINQLVFESLQDYIIDVKLDPNTAPSYLFEKR